MVSLIKRQTTCGNNSSCGNGGNSTGNGDGVNNNDTTGGGGSSNTDRNIALGVGLGVGIPGAIAAVWKIIKCLRDREYEVKAQPPNSSPNRSNGNTDRTSRPGIAELQRRNQEPVELGTFRR
jgi:hypothetical protein